MNASLQLGGNTTEHGLASLIQALRSAGFPIGASEASDATRLLIELAATEPELVQPAALRTRVRPIFCKTREEQERFDPIFDEWLERVHQQQAATQRQAEIEQLASQAERATQDTRTPTSKLRRILAAAGRAVGPVLMLVLIISWVFSNREPPTVPVTQPPTNEQTDGTTSQNGDIDASVAPSPTRAADAATIEGFVPAVRWNKELRPVWVWLLVLLPLIAILGVSLPAMVLSRTRLRGSGDPMYLDPRPLEIAARKLVPTLRSDISDRLARHVYSFGLDIDRLARRPVLDVRGTIEATLRNIGIPTLKFSHARIHPSYLLLVDVANEREPRGRFFYQWAERMQREGLDIRIYWLRKIVEPNGAMSCVYAPWAVAQRAHVWKPLARLRAPQFGERLIIVSDGEPLVDSEGNWREAALRARFYRWRDRALFTPVEPRDWGVREQAIERPERAADPGFIVLPIEESALGAWIDLVLSGRLSTVELDDPQRFPALLRRGRSDAYTTEEPPSSDKVEKLIAQLRVYLGEWGFYWLVACAVPPLVRWELTLLLGHDVLKEAPRFVREADLHDAMARYYKRLVRLPWMRCETMPAWLRLRLLQELPSGKHRHLQDIVRTRLGMLERQAGIDGIELSFERPPGDTTAASARTSEQDSTRRGTPDALYLGYVSGLTPDQLLLRAPREWSSWTSKLRLQSPRGWRGLLARLRDRCVAWWARVAWTNGLPHLGVNPSGLLISALLAAPLVFAIVAATRSQPTTPHLTDDWLFVDTPRRVAWHTGLDVRALAVDTTGNRAVVAARDEAFESILQLFDLKTGVALGEPWKDVGAASNRVMFSPDGTRLLSSGTHVSRLWDAESGRLIGTLDGADSLDGPSIAVFTGDRPRLASPGAVELALWDARTGEPLNGVRRSDAPVLSIASSGDGSRVVTGLRDGTVQLWDVRANKLLETSKAEHGIPVTSVAISLDGTRVVSADRGGSINVWSVASRLAVERRIMHGDGLVDAALNADGSRIISVGSDGLIRTWNADAGQEIGSPLQAPMQDVIDVAPFGYGSQFALLGADGQVLTFDATAAQSLQMPMTSHNGPITSLAFSPDGKRLVSASSDATLRLWNTATGDELAVLRGHESAVSSVAFDPDGTRVVSAGADGTVRTWELDGDITSTICAEDLGVLHVAFSPDGALVASAGADHVIRLWDCRGGKLIGVIADESEGVVTSIAFSPSGEQIARGDDNGTLSLWSVSSRELLARMERDLDKGGPYDSPHAHDGSVSALAFDSKGTRMVSGGWDGVIRLWDPRTGRPIGAPIIAEQDGIGAVAFSPSGRQLVSASSDTGTIRFWDAATHEPIGSPIDAVGASAIAFHPNGRVIAAAANPSRPTKQQDKTAQAQIAAQTYADYSSEVFGIQLWRVAAEPPAQALRSSQALLMTLSSRLRDSETWTFLLGVSCIAWTIGFSVTRTKRRRAMAREAERASA